MNNHVTSLSLSRELWEAGLRVESHFVWVDKFPIFNDTDRLATREDLQYRLDNCILSEEAKKLIKFYPALMESELEEMLPDRIYVIIKGRTDQTRFPLTIEKNGDSWSVYYSLWMVCHHVEVDKSLTEAMAKMLLHLIREGLVDVKSLNGEWKI